MMQIYSEYLLMDQSSTRGVCRDLYLNQHSSPLNHLLWTLTARVEIREHLAHQPQYQESIPFSNYVLQGILPISTNYKYKMSQCNEIIMFLESILKNLYYSGCALIATFYQALLDLSLIYEELCITWVFEVLHVQHHIKHRCIRQMCPSMLESWSELASLKKQYCYDHVDSPINT